MMDCKKALEATQGDMEAAIDLLRKKGAAVEAKRGGNATSEGLVHAYIHPGAQIGVLVEINCETDFVARTEDMKRFAHDVCMHIAAQNPRCISTEELDPAFLAKEREIAQEQLANSGKPAHILASIVQGKMDKLVASSCLLQQQFVFQDIRIKDFLILAAPGAHHQLLLLSSVIFFMLIIDLIMTVRS